MIVVFTNTYPYDKGESFFETELPFLLSLQRPILIVPLYGSGPARPVPSIAEAPVTVAPPLLPFSPKNRCKLLFHGLCNAAPVFFGVKEFFVQKAWRSRLKMWRLASSWLLIRATLSKNMRLFSGLLKTSNPEQLTLYFYWGDKSALLLPFLRKKFSLSRAIVRFHGSDLYEEAYGFHPFRNLLLPAIDVACPVSQHGADYLRQHYGAICPPISISRLGTCDYGLGPEPQVGAPFLIVCCARMVPIKRVHLIWEALKLLHDTHRLPVSVAWSVIGEGPALDELDTVVEAATLSDKLTVYIFGQLSHEELMHYYCNTPVDLFMLTSQSEGVPVSVMEALSFGIPVMATAVGGVPELVSQTNGHLLPAHPKVDDVAEALLNFIELSTAERQAKRQSARAVWESNWSAEVNFTQFCRLH